jgi:hypothetical protein
MLLVMQLLLQEVADRLDWAWVLECCQEEPLNLDTFQPPLLVAAHATAVPRTAAIHCHAV